ncbi:MAG: SOS response-associated peptidase [bacterium]|nr:SOS response-associated peptidase [bacterium]
MCGRYSFFSKDEVFEDRWQAKFELPINRHYNAAPSQKLPVILNDNPKIIKAGQWGLIPQWMKNNPKGIINARAETITEKPSFRSVVKKQRCLVLADSFFEWNRKSNTKTPYRILLTDEKPFAFAGIWETYQTDTGLNIPTFSIITVPANEQISKIHDRMPVILQPNYEQLWIDDSAELNVALETLKTLPDEQIKMYEVSSDVNSYKNESANLIQPI